MDMYHIEKEFILKIMMENNICLLKNNNGIDVIEFSKEDLSFIPNEMWKILLNRGYKSILKLIEYIHFNNNKPEYNNIYINNINNQYILLFINNCWNYEDQNVVIDRLFNDKRDLLLDKYDELYDILDEVTIKKFTRFMEDIENNKIINDIKNDIKLLLYNKRIVPLNTKKIFEEKIIENNNLCEL